MVGAAIRERLHDCADRLPGKQRFENPLLPYTFGNCAAADGWRSRPGCAERSVYERGGLRSTGDRDDENMASQVAIALENARLFQDAQLMIKRCGGAATISA
jgi:hypothetical protein